MNNTQNLVNNEDNTILQQKNYPSAISESEKMCSSDGYKTPRKCCGLEEGKIKLVWKDDNMKKILSKFKLFNYNKRKKT